MTGGQNIWVQTALAGSLSGANQAAYNWIDNEPVGRNVPEATIGGAVFGATVGWIAKAVSPVLSRWFGFATPKSPNEILRHVDFSSSNSLENYVAARRIADQIIRSVQNVRARAGIEVYNSSSVLSSRHMRMLDEGVGFSTFDDLKAFLGNPPPGHAWHHIVGQNQGNLARFGQQYIHNTANIIAIPHGKGSVHLAQIEAFLNPTRREITGPGYVRVRDWLTTKDYQYQYEFGVLLLKNNGVPLP